jgi:hypothetical protein
MAENMSKLRYTMQSVLKRRFLAVYRFEASPMLGAGLKSFELCCMSCQRHLASSRMAKKFSWVDYEAILERPSSLGHTSGQRGRIRSLGRVLVAENRRERV